MRINKKDKKTALDNFLKNNFKPKLDTQIEKLKELKQEAADNYYDEKTQTWIDAAPEGFLFARNGIDLLLNGSRWSHRLIRNIHPRIRMKRVGVNEYYNGFTKELTTAQQKRLISIEKELNKLEKLKETMTRTVESALASCNTLKQLQEHFPDLVPYLPKPSTGTGTQIAISNNDIKELME